MICYQFNLEYLTQVVWSNEVDGQRFAFLDTLFSTDLQFIHHLPQTLLQFHPSAEIYTCFYSLQIAGLLKECGLHSQSNYTDEDYDIKQYRKVIADADQQAHAVIPSR